jgi:predicted membrane protein
MRKQGQVIIGVAIILFGLLILIDAVFDIDFGLLCWPTVLILLGIWILIRPWVLGPDTAMHVSLFGPVRRSGTWSVNDQEIWMFVGDVRLDFTEAEVPLGETQLQVFSFVGDVRARVPEGVGISASSTSFINTIRVMDKKRETFVVPAKLTSEGYEAAERKIHLHATGFIADLRVKQA